MNEITVDSAIRFVAMLEEERNNPEQLFYISFAEPNRFLGAVITKAPGFLSAVMKTHELGINPGGEAFGGVIDLKVDPKFLDKLLKNRKECEEAVGNCIRWGDLKDNEA